MIKTITRDELVKMMSSGRKIRVIDVLPRESYEKEHIKGAISLPLSEINKAATRSFKKDETIVAYCASFECQASTNAAKKLMDLGFKNVLDYKGGLKDYKEGNLLLESSSHQEIAKATCGCCC